MRRRETARSRRRAGADESPRIHRATQSWSRMALPVLPVRPEGPLGGFCLEQGDSASVDRLPRTVVQCRSRCFRAWPGLQYTSPCGISGHRSPRLRRHRSRASAPAPPLSRFPLPRRRGRGAGLPRSFRVGADDGRFCWTAFGVGSSATSSIVHNSPRYAAPFGFRCTVRAFSPCDRIEAEDGPWRGDQELRF